jgi:hypothetical protein
MQIRVGSGFGLSKVKQRMGTVSVPLFWCSTVSRVSATTGIFTVGAESVTEHLPPHPHPSMDKDIQ